MEVEGAGGAETICKNDKRRADVLKKDATMCMNGEANHAVDLNEDKLIESKKEVKMVGKTSRSLLFRKRMKRLSPHCRPLKDRMKDKMVSYIDLLRLGPPPSRTDKMNPQASRSLAN